MIISDQSYNSLDEYFKYVENSGEGGILGSIARESTKALISCHKLKVNLFNFCPSHHSG